MGRQSQSVARGHVRGIEVGGPCVARVFGEPDRLGRRRHQHPEPRRNHEDPGSDPGDDRHANAPLRDLAERQGERQVQDAPGRGGEHRVGGGEQRSKDHEERHGHQGAAQERAGPRGGRASRALARCGRTAPRTGMAPMIVASAISPAAPTTCPASARIRARPPRLASAAPPRITAPHTSTATSAGSVRRATRAAKTRAAGASQASSRSTRRIRAGPAASAPAARRSATSMATLTPRALPRTGCRLRPP